MDLLKIRVENFRCFQGVHELDVTDGPLWIVRGENGSGKSTLICDSILFSLFNTIPSIEGSQSLKKTELININSTSMSSQIWFNHNGNKYSIKRSYVLKGRSKQLHHQFEAWENKKLLIDTAKQDEARIFISERFWDIEDFRNTTIILQKEITNSLEQRESERKKSIEKIFNIERFEKMSELAHKHSRDSLTDIKIISNSIEDIKKQIVNEEELQAKKVTNKEALTKAKKDKDDIESELRKNKGVKERLEEFVLKGNNLKEKISQRNIDLKNSQKDKQILTEDLIKLESDLSKEKELITNLQKIEQLEKIIEPANAKLEEIKNKEKDITSYSNLMKQKQQALETEIKQMENSQTLYKKQYETLNNELNSLKDKEALIPSLTEVVKTLPSLHTTKEKIQNELDQAEILEKNLFSKNKDLEHKKTVIKDQLNDLEIKISKFNSLEKEKKDAEAKIQYSRTHGKELEKKIENFDELQQKEQELKSSIFKIDHETNIIKDTLNNLNLENKEFKSLNVQGICPKCKQKLDEKHLLNITEENSVKINEIEDKIKKNSETKNNFSQTLVSVGKDLSAMKAVNQELEKVKNTYVAEKTRLESIDKQITSLKPDLDKFKEIKKRFDQKTLFSELESEILQLKAKIPDTNSLKMQKTDVEKKILDSSKKETELIGLQNQLKDKSEKEKSLQIISKELSDISSKLKEKTEILTSKIFAKEEVKALEQLKKQIENLQKEIPELEKNKEKLHMLNPEKTRLAIKDLDMQKGIHKEKIERIKKIDSVINTITNDIKNLEEELKEINLDKLIPDVSKYKSIIENLEKQVLEANKHIIKLELEIQSIDDQIAKNNKIIIELKAKEKEFELLKNKKDDYDLLEKLFKDIGKRILNRVMSRINLYSTEILSKLGNDQLEQITLLESKNGFELKIVSDGEERYPAWFSGGQKVRIGLAFRLSLSRTLAEITGGDIESILIDEGDFGALDEQGLKGVSEILNDLKFFFKRMIVVTHMDRLADELDGNRLAIRDSKIILESKI